MILFLSAFHRNLRFAFNMTLRMSNRRRFQVHLHPVFGYKENLVKKALDKSSTSVLAVKELCSQSEDRDFNEEFQTKVDLLSQKGLELLTNIGKRILLFETQSSKKSSYSAPSYHAPHSHKKQGLKKVALQYEQQMNNLAIKREIALLEEEQRLSIESDHLKHVAESNPLINVNNQFNVDIPKRHK